MPVTLTSEEEPIRQLTRKQAVRKGGLPWPWFAGGGGILVLAALIGLWLHSRPNSVELTTPYQAVLLSNGTVYFGRLEGLGSAYPVLHDVFYVQSAQDPSTKQVSNTLVKRGKELHGPDRMILNAGMIILVEPVGPSSRVAQLILQAH